MATLILLRHGRTTANASGLLAGWTPGVRLDERGEAQARGVGERLAAAGLVPDLVVSSPLERCQQTADLLGDGLGARVARETDERLGECKYGAWTGRPIKELAKEPLWQVVQHDPPSARFPESAEYAAESLPEMRDRALAAVRELDARVEGEHGPRAVWVAVSHGDVIKSVLAELVGSGLPNYQRIVVDPASVSVVRLSGERALLLRMNDTGGSLQGLRPPESAAGHATEGVVGGGSGDAQADAEQVSGEDVPAREG